MALIEQPEEDEGPYVPRQICIGWIVSTEYIQRVLPFWRPELLSTDLTRILCGWCNDYYQKYDQAPLSDIEGIFHQNKKKLDPDTADQIEMMLESLSDEYLNQSDALKIDYLVDQTRTYLREQAHRQRLQDYEDLIERGELDKAEALLGTPLSRAEDEKAEVITGSAVKRRKTLWLARGVIPRGYLTLVAGPKNVGKTLFLEWVAAQMSRSGRLSDKRKWRISRPCAYGHTLVMTAEDEAGDMIMPRFDAAGGNDRCIHFVRGVTAIDEDGQRVIDLWNVKNISKLDQWLDHHRRVQLVTIDPVGDFMPEQKRGMTSAYQHVRRSLLPLAKLAARRGIAIVLTTHLRKGHEGSALDKIIDSTGFTTLARMVIMLAPHPDYDATTKPYRGVLAVAATNLVPRPWPSFEYRVDSVEVDSKVGEQPVFVEEGPSHVTAEELMTRPKSSEERSAQEVLRDWVYSELKDGPVPSKKLFRRGQDELRCSHDQIRRALHFHMAEAKPQGQGKPWAWTLPKGQQKSRSLL